MSDTAAPATHLPDLLTFDVTVTLEDQLALQMRCLAAPAMRAGQLRRMVATAVIAAVLGPVFFTGGILIAAASDPDGSPFGATFRDMVLDRPGRACRSSPH